MSDQIVGLRVLTLKFVRHFGRNKSDLRVWSLIHLECTVSGKKKSYGPDKLRWEEAEEAEAGAEEKIWLKQYVSLRSKGRHKYDKNNVCMTFPIIIVHVDKEKPKYSKFYIALIIQYT